MAISKTIEAAPRGAQTRLGGKRWRFVYEPLIFGAVMTVLFLVAPTNWQFVLTQGVIYMLFATSLGMLFGWSGIYTFGHAVFFGVGAYVVALTKDLGSGPLVYLGIGVVAAGAIAGLVALLGLRLVKVEFAMMTLILGQIAYQLTYRIDGLQGDNGIYGIPRGSVLFFDITPSGSFWWYVLAIAIVAMMVLRRVQLSPFGEALSALRDDPIKASAIGIPVRTMRFVVFTLAGAVAGLAGGLFAQHQGIVTPNTLAFLFSGQVIIMALLGGMARFWGPAVGALVYVALNFAIFSGDSNSNLVLGIVLLVVVLLLPKGLLGVIAWARDRIAARRRGDRGAVA